VQEEVLAKAPDTRLRVYAIWTEKLFGDSRDKWDGGDLIDPRVVHLWDEADVSGTWFVEDLPGYRGEDWDTYLLFGPEARWDSVPSPLLASGSTVIARSDELKRAIAPLLGAPER
jgi:hypothetical protein